MKPVRILVDSTVDLPERCRAQVRAVPLTVHFGDEELIDGVTIDRRRFYERLIESDVLPTTSQATPAAFVKEFEAVRQAGESAVVITISAELSGTYQSACIAAADYEDIYVVDSRSAAIGSGILAELALEWAADGMAAAELAGLLTKKRDDICLLGLLDTLEYLRRGGRIYTASRGGCVQWADRPARRQPAESGTNRRNRRAGLHDHPGAYSTPGGGDRHGQ